MHDGLESVRLGCAGFRVLGRGEGARDILLAEVDTDYFRRRLAVGTGRIVVPLLDVANGTRAGLSGIGLTVDILKSASRNTDSPSVKKMLTTRSTEYSSANSHGLVPRRRGRANRTVAVRRVIELGGELGIAS